MSRPILMLFDYRGAPLLERYNQTRFEGNEVACTIGLPRMARNADLRTTST